MRQKLFPKLPESPVKLVARKAGAQKPVIKPGWPLEAFGSAMDLVASFFRTGR